MDVIDVVFLASGLILHSRLADELGLEYVVDYFDGRDGQLHRLPYWGRSRRT